MASYIDMIVAHLNAPYGALLTADDVTTLLRDGDRVLLRHDRAVASILGALFDECSPALVERACIEARIPMHTAEAAYASLVRRGARRVPAWEARLAA